MQDNPFPLRFDTLAAFCQRQGLRFKANPDLQQIAVHQKILGQDAPLYLIPRPERRMVTLALPLPFCVPAERLPQVSECLTRLNSASFMGAWVLNLVTGEVYFRVSLPMAEVTYTDQALLFVARLVVATVKEAASAVQRVAFEDAPPSEVWSTG